MRSFLAFAALLAVLALIIPFGAALALPGSLPTGPAQPAASRTGPPQAPSENPAVSIPDSGSGGTEKTGSSVPAFGVSGTEESDSSVSAPSWTVDRETGSFLVYDRGTGELMNLEAGEYILGALASEMPPSFHAEALKAQAVAAHTWAVYSANQHREHPTSRFGGRIFRSIPPGTRDMSRRSAFSPAMGPTPSFIGQSWRKRRVRLNRCCSPTTGNRR